MRWTIAASLLLASAHTSGQTAPNEVISAADKAAYDLAHDRGFKLYFYDQAAWHGTDDMIAKLPDYANIVGGYVTDGPPGDVRLTFFDRSAVPKAVYVAQFRGSKLISSKVLGADDDTSLDPGRLRLIAARTIALEAFRKADVRLCAKATPNTAVLPPETPDGPVLAYLLTPQMDTKVMPFGGHYRVEVAADGAVGPIKRFTTACLDMPVPDAKKVKGGGPVVSQILDPLPTEIHFFAALALRTNIFVATPNHPDLKVWVLLNPYDQDRR